MKTPLGVIVIALSIALIAPAAAPSAALAGVSSAQAAAKVRTTVQDVSEGLTCQCGCGLTVANCNHPNCSFAVPLRKEIEGMIKTGMSRVEIIAAFRKKYGEKILSAPTSQGFNLLAWTAPFAAVAAGVLLILITMRRWRMAALQPPAAAPEPHVADEDSRLREMLERELREQI